MDTNIQDGRNQEQVGNARDWLDFVIAEEQAVEQVITPEANNGAMLVETARIAGNGIAQARRFLLERQATETMIGENPNPGNMFN